MKNGLFLRLAPLAREGYYVQGNHHTKGSKYVFQSRRDFFVFYKKNCKLKCRYEAYCQDSVFDKSPQQTFNDFFSGQREYSRSVFCI